MRINFFLLFSSVTCLVLSACGAPVTVSPATAAPTPTTAAPLQKLRLATTTSTADTGLLKAILPLFEKKYNAKVETVAVGTGQAMTIGAKGDAEVLLVHARAQEDKFMADGLGALRLDVMYNDFILVGAKEDPASVKGLKTAAEAFAVIAKKESVFASRGDESGTHSKEKSIWAVSGLTPTKDLKWYSLLGQGMGETLIFANEKKTYTLTDRGTWLAQKDKLPSLMIIVGGDSIKDNADKNLLNPYGVIVVSQQKFPAVNAALATQFAEWLTAVETQKVIGEYGQDKFQQPLFYPSSEAWRKANP